MRFAIALLALLWAAPAVPAQESAIPPDANLVVFRKHALPLLWAPTLEVDGRKIAKLGEKTFTAIHLSPGRHHIMLNWPALSGQQDPEGTLLIEDGKPIFLQVIGTEDMDMGVGTYILRMGASVVMREPSVAGTIAECCKFKPPKP